MNDHKMNSIFKMTAFHYLMEIRMYSAASSSPRITTIAVMLICALLLATLSGCKHDSKTTIIRYTMNPWEKDIGYAEVVEANGTVYVSGVVCGDEGGSYAKAVPECYAQLTEILTKLKLTPKNIVKENVYAKNIDAFKEQIPARKAFYGNENYPAATWIEASRFYLSVHLVEIELIAVRTE